MKKAALALALGTLALMRFRGRRRGGRAARDGGRRHRSGLPADQGRYSRRYATHVRTYRGRRIGFYSYSYRDVINTYGMSRARYGSINSYRDPFVDMQTPNGPFDHGFFFDSGMMPRGGNAPYLR